jgi:hypothetical protein
MSVNTVNYLANLAANTFRGPSTAIWGSCPVNDLREEPDKGMYFFDDFLMVGNADMSSAYKNSIGQWSVYGDAGALLADGAAEGGVLTYGSDGDNEGVCLLSAAGSFRLVTTSTLALNGKLWFECRLATSTVTATKHEDFVGLAIPALSSGLPRAAYPITATDNTLDSTNGTFIGFHRKGNAATEWQFCFNLAGGTVNYVTGLTTLMNTVTGAVLTASSFVKLGFIFDPFAYPKTITSATARQTAGAISRPLITVYVNGLAAPTFLSSADVQNGTAGQAFPTGFMAPIVQCFNQTGSSPGTSSIDWIRVAQMAST